MVRFFFFVFFFFSLVAGSLPATSGSSFFAAFLVFLAGSFLESGFLLTGYSCYTSGLGFFY